MYSMTREPCDRFFNVSISLEYIAYLFQREIIVGVVQALFMPEDKAPSPRETSRRTCRRCRTPSLPRSLRRLTVPTGAGHRMELFAS